MPPHLRSAGPYSRQQMSITASDLVSALQEGGVSLFTGVADSLLSALSRELEHLTHGAVHVPAPNEGSAVGIAAGHYLATGRVAVVYLQNSGLGNAVNPLLSLADTSVYGIPMLLVIGWRGEPGRPDEPQHVAQGRLTRAMLDLIGVPHWILPSDPESAVAIVSEALIRTANEQRPVALVVSKGVITGDNNAQVAPMSLAPTRADVLNVLVDSLPTDTVFVATTGYTGRELAQLRHDRGQEGELDLLVVGSMGHATSLALGMAIGSPDVPVCCIDGDGALAMHLGAVAAVGHANPANLLHVVVNNGVHESVGGQPTCVGGADLAAVATALGYPEVETCRTTEEFRSALEKSPRGPRFIEVIVVPGVPASLVRPDSLGERKRRLMSALTGT